MAEGAGMDLTQRDPDGCGHLDRHVYGLGIQIFFAGPLSVEPVVSPVKLPSNAQTRLDLCLAGGCL